MKKIIACLLSVCILFTACSFEKNSGENFDEYLSEVFAEGISEDSLVLHFLLKNPENFGIEAEEPTFGEVSHEQSAEDVEEALEELRAFPYKELSGDQKICFRIMEWYLELEKEYYGLEKYDEPLDVWTGVQTSLPVNLAEYAFDSEKDVEEYLLLLDDTGRYFGDIIAFEQGKSVEGLFMSDAELEQVLAQCRDFTALTEENYLITSFAERLNSLEISAQKREEYIEKNREKVLETVIPAYEKLIFEMEKLMGTGAGNGGFCRLPDGKRYYEYLVKQVSGTEKSVPQVAEMIDGAVEDYLERKRLLEERNPGIWHEYVKFTYPENDPERILSLLQTEIQKDFPPCPDVDVQVKKVDASMEDTSGLAFYFIPPLDMPAENLIYINGSEKYKDAPLFPTLAHEGYPGHMYQNAVFQAQNANMVRRLYTNLGYLEGWATYAECYSYSLAGAEGDLLEAIQLLELLNMAFYTRADIGVHYEGWTAEDIFRHFEPAGMTMERAERIEDLSLTHETHMVPYYVGYLELEELKAFAEEKLGESFDLKEFHRVVLETGPAPFKIVREQVEEWVNKNK